MLGFLAAGLGFLGANADRKQRSAEYDQSTIERSEDRATIERHRAEDIARQSPAAIRASMEAAGFSPLLGVDKANAGVGSYGTAARSGVGYGPTFGSSVANAMSIGLDGFHKEQVLEIQRTQLDKENKRLNETIRTNRLNPKVGGIYANVGKTTPLGGSNHLNPVPQNVPERERVNKYIDVWDPDSQRYVSIVNPELTESGPLEMATGLGVLEAAGEVRYGTTTKRVTPYLNDVLSVGSAVRDQNAQTIPTSSWKDDPEFLSGSGVSIDQRFDFDTQRYPNKNTSFRPQYGVWSRAF